MCVHTHFRKACSFVLKVCNVVGLTYILCGQAVAAVSSSFPFLSEVNQLLLGPDSPLCSTVPKPAQPPHHLPSFVSIVRIH